MPSVIIGILATSLLFLNILVWASVILSLVFLRKILPFTAVHGVLSTLMLKAAMAWVHGNSGWMHLTPGRHWDIRIPGGLNKHGWYFVVCNHQSWTDIFLLQHTLKNDIPFLKFFIKHELIKMPIMGAVWWALDFPFMKRYSKEYLEKHPEMRGKDLETTRIACEKFKELPTSVVNYLEGTRLTPEKHKHQQSPFKHLLKPKSGGMAFAMNVMGDQFKSVIDVTIHYPEGIPSLWQFMQGKMKRCTIIVREIPVPETIRYGDYENDEVFRQRFQEWVRELWEEKDKALEKLEQEESQRVSK